MVEEGGAKVEALLVALNHEAAAIGKEAANNRAIPITIRADARTTHQSVVTAMDVAAHAGYRQLNIATVNDGQDRP